MNSKALPAATMLLFVGGVSLAVAAPPTGKGKALTSGAGCKPNVSVILRGNLASDGGAVPFSLSLTVSGGNHFAHAYKAAVQPISIQVTSATKISRQGDGDAADLKSGDQVNVRAQTCKTDLANGATPALTAARVAAHPAQA
jgi:hypothetical protein